MGNLGHEAALDRYRAWYRQRIAEEHALSAKLSGIRLALAKPLQK